MTRRETRADALVIKRSYVSLTVLVNTGSNQKDSKHLY